MQVGYHEGGRFGRITKNLRRLGFEHAMEHILHDSGRFGSLKKHDQVKYVGTVVERMVEHIGRQNTDRVLFECGLQCCGKTWSGFVKRIWDESTSVDGFFAKLNEEEEDFGTTFSYDPDGRTITIERGRCLCGLVNKGRSPLNNSGYCRCSVGHWYGFFNAVFAVEEIVLEQSICADARSCKWKVVIRN